jgi:hypothetical protein
MNLKKVEEEMKKLENMEKEKTKIKMEEIEEDIVEDHDNNNDDELAQSKGQRMFTDSGALTGSQSLGVDPSVDSLALEQYDIVEPVDIH